MRMGSGVNSLRYRTQAIASSQGNVRGTERNGRFQNGRHNGSRWGKGSLLAALESLEFLERARPVRSQYPGQTAIRKNFSTRLASGTIVRFVVRVANPLNSFAAPRARLSIASMHYHFLAKRGHPLWKVSLRFCAQPVHPELERIACGSEQSSPLLRYQLVCERDRRQLGRV